MRPPHHHDPIPSSWETGTLVLVPSLSFPVEELVKITGIDYYEERLLCAILALGCDQTRLVYVTSRPVDPQVVDYYLSFLAEPVSARSRLHLVAVNEAGPRPLSEKLLEHPDVLAEVVGLVASDPTARLVAFNVTEREAALASALGLPLDGAPADRVFLGSKTGSRRVARRAGVRIQAGEEELRSAADVTAALGRLRRRGQANQAVIKLNHGFSGQGSALVELAGVTGAAQDAPTTFCADGEHWSTYEAKIVREGAIVEEVMDDPWASPSVQLRVSPGGEVEVVSTHDQVLGGAGGQVYLGCRFPAHVDYRMPISRAALAVGRVLADEGVVGPFGIDFLVRGEAGNVEVVLSEINLRMGGTTHPFWMARLATGGRYDQERGELEVGSQTRCYVASDNLKVAGLAGRSPGEIIEALRQAGLAFDAERGRGVTLHLLGAVSGHAKLGATCIAEDLDAATELFAELGRALEILSTTARP